MNNTGYFDVCVFHYDTMHMAVGFIEDAQYQKSIVNPMLLQIPAQNMNIVVTGLPWFPINFLIF